MNAFNMRKKRLEMGAGFMQEAPQALRVPSIVGRAFSLPWGNAGLDLYPQDAAPALNAPPRRAAGIAFCHWVGRDDLAGPFQPGVSVIL